MTILKILVFAVLTPRILELLAIIVVHGSVHQWFTFYPLHRWLHHTLLQVKSLAVILNTAWLFPIYRTSQDKDNTQPSQPTLTSAIPVWYLINYFIGSKSFRSLQ